MYLNRGLVGKSTGSYMHRRELNVEVDVQYFVRMFAGFMWPIIGSRGGPHVPHLQTR
jgi:hypothetical protein